LRSAIVARACQLDPCANALTAVVCAGEQAAAHEALIMDSVGALPGGSMQIHSSVLALTVVGQFLALSQRYLLHASVHIDERGRVLIDWPPSHAALPLQAALAPSQLVTRRRQRYVGQRTEQPGR
jgi:hypothetical protein